LSAAFIGLMVKSVASQPSVRRLRLLWRRVSNHVPRGPSFETAASRSPQDEVE